MGENRMETAGPLFVVAAIVGIVALVAAFVCVVVGM